MEKNEATTEELARLPPFSPVAAAIGVSAGEDLAGSADASWIASSRAWRSVAGIRRIRAAHRFFFRARFSRAR